MKKKNILQSSIQHTAQYTCVFKVINVHAEQPHICRNNNFTVVCLEQGSSVGKHSARQRCYPEDPLFPQCFQRRSMTQLNDLH